MSDHDPNPFFPNVNQPMMPLLRYARLERPRTGSYLTYKIPGPGLPNLTQVEKLCKRTLPGWEVINASPNNPDEEGREDV